MSRHGQSIIGRITRKATLAAVAVAAAASLTATPASADLSFTARPPEPQRWWCWTQDCVDFSIASCESIGGTSWEVEVGIGTWGGCEFP